MLEASQTAVESSDQALRAAEVALNAAQTANKQAKDVLRAVTEAFVQEDRKLASTNIEGHPQQAEQVVNRASVDCESDGNSDDIVHNFVMLSTNKNLNNNIEDIEDDDDEDDDDGDEDNDVDDDDDTEDDTEGDDDICHNFLLISSTGPACDRFSKMFGLYRKTEEMKEGCSVYIREHDTQYGNVPYRVTINQGVWMLSKGDDVFLRAATPSECPTSVKWQYSTFSSNNNGWLDDQELTLSGLSQKPSVCEITISLNRRVARNIKEPGVAGVYRASGSYRQGRPVLQHSGGRFTIFVCDGAWMVTSDVGDEVQIHLVSGSAPSQCPADPRAARNEHIGMTHWGYENKHGGCTSLGGGISVNCGQHSI